MSINELAKHLGDACYGFLALNFLFGLYSVLLIWRRLFELRFRNQNVETEFIGQVQELLKARDFESAGVAKALAENRRGSILEIAEDLLLGHLSGLVASAGTRCPFRN